jgi:hypothetical protein
MATDFTKDQEFIESTMVQDGTLYYKFLEAKDVASVLKDKTKIPSSIQKNVEFEVSPKVTKQAQTVSVILGQIDKNLFKFVPSINVTKAPLIQLSFLNMDNDDIEEISASFPNEDPITTITF